MANDKAKAQRRLKRLLAEVRRTARWKKRRLGPHVVAELSALRQAGKEALQSEDVERMAGAADALERAFALHLHHLRKGALRSYVETILVAAIVALLFRALLFEVYRIPSGSMLPSLQPGDVVVVSKSAYGVRLPFSDRFLFGERLPERGDVVVFESPTAPGRAMAKRVIGLPGDHVAVVDDQVILNGEGLARRQAAERFELWNHRATLAYWHRQSGSVWVESIEGRDWATWYGPLLPTGLGDMAPMVVPEGHLFVLGDNRYESDDSRSGWLVPVERLRGKVKRIWFSWGPVEGAEAENQGFRWDRLWQAIDALP